MRRQKERDKGHRTRKGVVLIGLFFKLAFTQWVGNEGSHSHDGANQ